MTERAPFGAQPQQLAEIALPRGSAPPSAVHQQHRQIDGQRTRQPAALRRQSWRGSARRPDVRRRTPSAVHAALLGIEDTPCARAPDRRCSRQMLETMKLKTISTCRRRPSVSLEGRRRPAHCAERDVSSGFEPGDGHEEWSSFRNRTARRWPPASRDTSNPTPAGI
jgi:hypothetical protein